MNDIQLVHVMKVQLKDGDTMLDPTIIADRPGITSRLTVPGAIPKLLNYGFGTEAIFVIEKLEPQQRVAILATPKALAGLMLHEQERTIAMFDAFTPEQRVAVRKTPDADACLTEFYSKAGRPAPRGKLNKLIHG